MQQGETGGKNRHFLESVLKDCALKKTKKETYAKDGHADIERYISFSDAGKDYFYVYYKNNSKAVTLEEKFKFTEFKGLELQFPYSGDTINAVVGPGEEAICVIKRTEDQFKYSTMVYTSFKEANKDYAKEAKSKGDKQVISMDGKNYKIEYFTLYIDSGFIMQFVNNEAKLSFEAEFEFDLTNLKVRKEKGQKHTDNKFVVQLNPGEECSKYLDLIEPFEACNYQ